MAVSEAHFFQVVLYLIGPQVQARFSITLPLFISPPLTG